MTNHHAYYIEGPSALFGSYKEELKPLGRSPTGETLWAKEFERFGIDEARALVTLAALKNFTQATFLIATPQITTEAQQALLKLLEEPQVGSTFVLIVPHGVLLPTLRSRMLEYPKLQTSSTKNQTVIKFLSSSPKERSDFIAKLLKDEDGVKERARDFVNALEAHCVKLNFTQRQEGRQALEDIALVRDYLRDRSPSLKMLLEHLSVALPQV